MKQEVTQQPIILEGRLQIQHVTHAKQVFLDVFVTVLSIPFFADEVRHFIESKEQDTQVAGEIFEYLIKIPEDRSIEKGERIFKRFTKRRKRLELRQIIDELDFAADQSKPGIGPVADLA